jgi:hypothetical protein
MSRLPTVLRTMEHSVTRYHHTAEIGTAPEEVLEPAYWTHVAKSLRPGDEIVVTAPDYSWRSELLVRDADRTSASVMVISHKQFDKREAKPLTPTSNTDAMVPVWRGPTHKWSAVRQSDGEIIKTGFASKEDAVLWISNHARAVAA